MVVPDHRFGEKLVQLGDALDDAIQRLATLFDLIPAAIYALEAIPGTASGFRPTYISPQFEAITGYLPTDWWQPGFWIGHIHPEDLEKALVTQRCLGREKRIEHEYRFRHRDGHYVWICDRLTVQRDASGGISLVVGAWWDISARKDAERLLALQRDLLLALRQTDAPEAAMQAILDAALSLPGVDCGGIYDVDPADGLLTLAIHAGVSAEYAATVRSYARDSRCGAIAHAGRPRYSFDRTDPLEVLPYIRAEGLRALAIIPILHDRQLVACFDLGSRQADSIPDATCRALETLALQLGETLLRVRSEADAKAQQRNLLALFTALDDCVFVVDDGGRIVYQNPAVERRLGYSTAELQGRSVLAVHPPNRHDEATTILRDLLAGRGTISPIPLQTKAGDLVPVETRVSRGEWNGRPALFGVSRDMTEWHAAQEALCDSEVLFRAMANSAQDAIAMMDEQGSISFWNKAAERIFGYAPEDAIGQDAHALLAPARYREVFQYAFARWRQTGNGEAIGKTIELVGCRKEGIEFPIELSLASVRLKGCWNAIAIIRDITRRKGLEEALRQRERYQRALLDNFPFLVWLKDTESRFLAVNGPFVAACDQPNADALVGKTDADVWPKDLAERYCADDRDVLASGKSKVIEELVVNKGIRRWMETYKSPVTLAGRVIGIVGFARDISERKQAEEQQRLAASIFAHAHEGIMMIDAAAKIVEINAAFSELTGYSREEVLGRNVRFLQSGRHPPEFYAEMRRTLLETGHWRGEVWNHHKNGQPIATRLTISAVQDNSGAITHYVGVFSDITALKESEQRLEFLAYYDALTRLPNRALLADRLGLAIARTERQKDLLAVCYLDLDGFKPVNDLLGHAAGDQLLVAVAERLRRCVRGDDTVARLGGDEFVVLFGGLNGVDECENAITRLLRTLAVPHALGDRTFEVTASIGVTLYPLDSSDADTLLRHADQAMYRAKQKGRNRYLLFGAD
ncbi:MAG TPA: PAS domain S-box protein [Candidatus Competibacter sp.]|nr:PAS domain S-box protein [Candidatus Competibacter sp.]